MPVCCVQKDGQFISVTSYIVSIFDLHIELLGPLEARQLELRQNPIQIHKLILQPFFGDI